MDRVEEFMIIFKRCREEKQGKELYRLFDEGSKYIRDISEENKALALQRLLGGDDGILAFLTIETDERDLPQLFVTAALQGFHFLKFIVIEFISYYRPYAIQTMNCCIEVLSRRGNFYLKAVASSICVVLLKNFPNGDFSLQNTIDTWMRTINLYTYTEVSLLLRVISTVAHRQPDIIESSDAVRRLLRQHFNRMFETRKCIDNERVHCLIVIIDSMNDMFRNFPLENDDATLKKLYQRIKHIATVAESNKDNGLIESILNFMNHQMTAFNTFIHFDYEFWHQYFMRQTDNENNSVLAIESLKVYYEVIGKLLYEDNTEKNQEILQSLNTIFMKNITNECLSSKDLRISINGYSRISESIKKVYNNAAVEEMYSTIARRTLSLFFSEDEANDLFEDIADYQEALSRIILHISHVSSDQIKQLSKLCIIMIKRFPELSVTSQQYAIDSLKRTVCNIESLKVHVSRELITNIMFEGIVWSCSHSLAIDAEYQQELENLPKRPICYKDYIPLWRGLLNYQEYQRVSVSQQVTNQAVDTCVKLIERLNLSIQTRENNVYSDLTMSQVATNETDFRIFLNMVDLYDEILDDMDPCYLMDKIPQFLYKIIEGSYKHPLISGFYRLVDRVLNATDYFQDEDNKDLELYQMVLHYLQNVIDSIYQLPHELQVRCVQLLLHMPMTFASCLINETVPIFKIALTVGLNDYELANSALDSLEKYLLLGNDRVKNFIKDLLPLLELYLRSNENSITCVNFKGNLKTFQQSEGGLDKLQNRILLFFGRVDHSVIFEFLHEQSLNTGATWDKKDLLKYSLSFPDRNLDVYLDTVLPRIIELALNSIDRQTKLAASEVVHSIVSIVLGKTVQLLSAEPDRFASVYKILCPAILRLGCDPDEVIRRLYNPLMLQLTHWLSSKLMLHSPTVEFLVDTIFDGLSDETNFTLRDFSGICLAEFTTWAIKQSSDDDLSRAPININTIVDSITNLALHPSRCRRVAAATAFNCIHRILSENDEILNIFWLELFYSFVKSMNGCDDISIWNSIVYIKKVLIDKSRIFINSDSLRKIPPGFIGGTSKDAVYWLLSQCGVLDKNARSKSMELFECLATHLTHYNSANSAITNYLEIHGMSSLNKIILQGLDDTTLTFSVDYLRMFLRTLDCYIWLLHNQLIDNNSLFSPTNESWDVVLNCINNFILKALTTEFNKTNLDDYKNQFKKNSLYCETIVSLIDFLSEILMIEFDEKTRIHHKLLNENMMTLISRCILEPRRIGFDQKNVIIMGLLPDKLERLINIISTQTSNLYVDTLINRFNNDVKNISPYLFEVKYDNITDQIINLSAIKGLQILQKCSIFERLSVFSLLSLNTNEKLKLIFNALKLVDATDTWCIELESERKLYLGHLLEIHLNQRKTAAKMLIEIFLTDKTLLRVVTSKDRRKVLHGEYFFNTFRDVISRCLLNHMMETFEELIKWLPHNPDIVFFVIEELAIYLQQHKNKFEEIIKIFAHELIEKFSELKRGLSNIESRRKSFMNIYRTVVRFKDEPLDILIERGPMYVWILSELNKCTDLSQSACILNDFLICLAGENLNDNFEIKFILQSLKKYRGDINNSDTDSILSAKAKEYYQALLTLLPVTKSNVVFTTIIDFSMGAAKYFCNEATNNNLQKYFNNISSANAFKSLIDVYRLFMDSEGNNERFDVLMHFLLPSIKSCNNSLIEEFFNQNIVEIFKTLWQEPPMNLIDYQKFLISQIGCYNLIELMFARLELESINEKYSSAACEILQNSKTGLVHQRVFRCTFQVRKLKTDVPESKEIMRKLHCAALNCAITMASALREENYYLALFAENAQQDQMIWQNIVDCEKKYHLIQTFKEFPKKRRTLVNIKQSIKNQTKLNSSMYSYIKSYSLASSTLIDDVYAYDFNDVRLYSTPFISSTAITLEVDDFNNHECMPSICGILKVMIESDSNVASQSERQPPKSLRCFASAMCVRHYNARLFMLKIILNNQAVFKPFAKIFLLPMITTVTSMLKEGPFNYIVTDTLLVMIDWAEIAVPTMCKVEAQEMFSHVVDKVDTLELTKYIVRYNFSIIELLVNAWHECLDIPSRLNERIQQSQACSIRVILIILSNKMAVKFENRPDILEFLIKSFGELREDKEDTLLQTCEAIGLFLKMKYFKNPENLLEPENRILASIREVLQVLQQNTPERLVKCVHAMSKAYPLLSQFFFEFVTHNHLKVSAPNKARCLEVFLQKIVNEYITNEDIVRELNYMKFNDLLKNRVISCEKICLEIVDRLVLLLNATDIFPLLNTASFYSQHADVEYRQLTYNIFMSAYKKYADDVTEDYHTQMLVRMSKKVLLPGLLDPAEELKEKLTTFWTEEIKFGDKCEERILNIFDVYLPDVEKNFLPILAIIFLHSIKKSPTYQTKMFEPLTHICHYKNYKIAASWRKKNLTYKIPLFASSYASQYNQRYTLSSLTANDLVSTNHELMLRATAVPEFEPTIQNDTFLSQNPIAQLIHDKFEFAIPESSEINIKSRRFTDKLWSLKYPASRRTEGNYTRHPTDKSQTIEQPKMIKLNRTYRIGDFPDIEITHESFINPLQELIKQDQLVCKNFVVSMIHSLLNQIRDSTEKMKTNCKEFLRNFREKLDNVLENRRGNGLIISAILEIMFHIEDIPLKSYTIMNISKVTGFNYLGALLLEQHLISYSGDSSPPLKKRRTVIDEATNVSSEIDNWVYLAELYESISEVDVALSIFLNHVPEHREFHEASTARAANQWNEAFDRYKEVYHSGFGSIERYSQQAMIECLGRLSNWGQIFVDIKGTVIDADNVLNYIVENANSMNNGWKSMWFCRAGIYQALTGNEIDGDGNEIAKFVDDMITLLKIPAKEQQLKELFAEEISAFCVIDNPEYSRDFLNSALKRIREQWKQLRSFFSSLRALEIIKMRGICNVDMYGKVLDDVNKISSELMNYWHSSIPHSRDDLLSWDYHMSYRSYFAKDLVYNTKNPQFGVVSRYKKIPIINETIRESILNTIIQLKLRMVEVAFQQKNKSIMSKYLNSIHSDIIEYEGPLRNKSLIDDEFNINVARYRMLRGETGNSEEKLQFYFKGWKKAEQILENTMDVNIKIAVQHLISDLSSKIIEFAMVDADKLPQMIKNVDKFISTYENISNDEFGKLYCCSFSNLKKSCIDSLRHSLSSDKIAECHLKLLKFCNDKIMANKANYNVIKEFIRSTLKAMSHGSREAVYYFPCILKSEYFDDEETKALFLEECKKVPCWRFLIWQSELMLCLSTPLEDIVTPIIRALIEQYPNAVIYTLRSIIDTNPEFSDHPIIRKYKQRLLGQTSTEKFMEAMQYLVQPELYLKYYLDVLLKNIKDGKTEIIDIVLKKIYPDAHTPSLQGKMYQSISNYRIEIERVREMAEADIETHILSIQKKLIQMSQKRKNSNQLKDYSPFLSQFTGTNIEIPGQYTGERKPIVEYHTKIAKIESKIQVMKSIRNPIKITFIGNDSKNYNFLVKFGEDLRLDEKVEQAFVIMNEILQSDIACSQRHLSINTYQVITMSDSLGLIQWIDNTKTLQDFINFTLNNEQKKRCDQIRQEYERWMSNACDGQQKRSLHYKESLIKYNAAVVNEKMTQLTNKIEWDLLRRTFLILNPSLESFMSSRNNFITSYATMCIAQWILGIGDRHLENILISIESGRSTGIDFASAFGGGIDQVIPELVPFRLTNQIRGLMKPFDEHDGFATIMTHVLRAIRNGKNLLLAYLNVVTEENLNWARHVNKLSQVIEQEKIHDVMKLQRPKIESVLSKLSGGKPSSITLNELKQQHYDGKYYPRYIAIVSGEDDESESLPSIRSRIINEDNLSPENQVKCLLDQATDLNILGRTYSGWCPWI